LRRLGIESDDAEGMVVMEVEVDEGVEGGVRDEGGICG
jgi:hypothetical protein